VKQEVEMRMDKKVLDILLPPGDEIVEADDLVALRQEAVREMRTQKPRPARDQGQRPEILAGHGI
jgi:hypothetical protein